MTATGQSPRTVDPASREARRPLPAGVALIVIVAALLAGLLLNATDILRTAERQEPGWIRTVGVTVMQPIADISHFLFLDRPRAALDAALGRNRSPSALVVETTDTTMSAATTAGGSAPATTPTTASPTTSLPEIPTRRTVSAADPLVLYIGGDSMVGQFGPMLQNRAADSDMVESEVVYEFESGLSRPDFVDWPERLADVQAGLAPDVFVLFFGGNDAQAIYMPDGSWIEYGTEEWEQEYRSRVDAVMNQLEDDGRWVYWMGMPVVRSETFLPKVELMNSIYEEVAADHPMVEYVSSWEVFEGPEGGYSEYLTNADGDLVDMRLDDGVHLTTNGGIRLAEVTYQRIAEDWGLPAG